MSKGKRYETEQKLNITKIFAVIIAILVLVMIVFIMKGIFSDSSLNRITGKSYFSIYKDGKWGVIDSETNVIIDTAYAEMIVIPNKNQDIFLCTYDVNYETGEYKTKALNSKNKEIFTEYEDIQAVLNKDENNNLWYEDNVLKVKKNGKYGLINLSGKELTEFIYDDISSISGVENSYKTIKDNKCGVINSDGKVIVDNKYVDITNLGTDNKSGYIVKEENGKFGIIDYSNNQVLEAKYDEIKNINRNDLYVVVDSGKIKLIRKSGEEVLAKGFDNIHEILANEQNGIIYIKSGKYGVMNLSGDITIDAEYDYLTEGKSGILIAKKDNKYGIIDLAKEEKIPFEYNMISYNNKADIYITEDSNFSSKILNSNFEAKLEGILLSLDSDKGYIKMKVGDEYKYYNFKFEEKSEASIFTNRTLFLSKKDGKYGFVDKNGKVIVDYIYDDAVEQNDSGFIAVKKDGKWGSLDYKGKVIQEPKYNLDDYLLVDFIGQWHLGLDLNMNYYNQE